MTSEHHYTPARTSDAAAVPDAVAAYLDGADLLARTQAVRLSTVDSAGWPHASLLSAGDVLALPSGRVRFVVYPESTVAANLVRDGRLALTLSLDGGVCELRARARRLPDAQGVPLAMFEAEVEQIREHRAPYADVVTGVTFALHDPQAVLGRWERQITAMRAAG